VGHTARLLAAKHPGQPTGRPGLRGCWAQRSM